MASLADTIARLTALRGPVKTGPIGSGADRLADLAPTFENPGALRARAYVPDGVAAGAPLVVVLHGCAQTAAGYDEASGWSRLADREGFALLYPEQQPANNPNRCFDWFLPEDSRRGRGEALSIRAMIGALVAARGLDAGRVHVVGLSAGGAMAAALLADYPEVFAGGAIIAGLPSGVASTAAEAFDRMRGHGLPGEERLQALLRAASQHEGRWPILSVWHGTADRVVDPVNAAAIVEQWRGVHGVDPEPALSVVDGYPRRAWRDAQGREVIEQYTIVGMGHGTPLATGGPDGLGAAAPFMLEAGISSTRRIAGFWGLTGQARAVDAQPRQAPEPRALATAGDGPATERADDRGAAPGWRAGPSAPTHAAGGIKKIIEDALRAAGLMR